MVSTPVRIAMVGLDHWYTALPLARAFAAHPEIELVGLTDADQNRAREVAASAGLDGPAGSERELLEDSRVDAIAAFASSDRNPAICTAAAAAGKHIISVKPLANTLDEATRLRTAVHDAGVAFLPAESRQRGAPLAQQLRRWRDEGRFGRILSASFQLWSGLPKSWPGATDPGWWTDPTRAPGGGWIDHSIYHIDLLRWLTGAHVTKVTGTLANLVHKELEVEDYGHATFEFDNGVIATDEVTWTAPPSGSRQTMSLVGADGALSHDSLTGRLSVTDQQFGGWVQVAAPTAHPNAIDDIITTVRGDGGALATVDDAWENLAVCEAFYRSAKTGQPVRPASLADLPA